MDLFSKREDVTEKEINYFKDLFKWNCKASSDPNQFPFENPYSRITVAGVVWNLDPSSGIWISEGDPDEAEEYFRCENLEKYEYKYFYPNRKELEGFQGIKASWIKKQIDGLKIFAVKARDGKDVLPGREFFLIYLFNKLKELDLFQREKWSKIRQVRIDFRDKPWSEIESLRLFIIGEELVFDSTPMLCTNKNKVLTVHDCYLDYASFIALSELPGPTESKLSMEEHSRIENKVSLEFKKRRDNLLMEELIYQKEQRENFINRSIASGDFHVNELVIAPVMTNINFDYFFLMSSKDMGELFSERYGTPIKVNNKTISEFFNTEVVWENFIGGKMKISDSQFTWFSLFMEMIYKYNLTTQKARDAIQRGFNMYKSMMTRFGCLVLSCHGEDVFIRVDRGLVGGLTMFSKDRSFVELKKTSTPVKNKK